MKIKLPALLFAALMAVSVLVGCGRGGSNKPGGDKPSNENNHETEEDRAIKDYVIELSEGASYEGQTFTYLGGRDENYPIKEEETGDIRSDALFKRQRDLEEIYGIDWENVLVDGSDEAADQTINEVMAGGDSFDLVNGYVRSVGRPTLNARVLMEMQDLDHIDLEREWWNQAMWDSYAIDGKLYFLLGPINVCHYSDTHIVIFNKSVTEMYGINDSDLYDSVKDGTWTIDKMFEFASAIPENPQGTGTYRYIEPGGRSFLYAAGYTITKFDENGLPYVEEKLPREFSDLSDKIVPVFTDAAQSVFENPKKQETIEDKYGASVDELFDDDRGLFMFPNTGAVEYMRQYDVRFGILPMPKLTESQQNYYCLSESYGGGSTGAVYVPKTVRDPEMVGRITESMAALSQIYIKDAYYNKLLKGQGIFDMESADMLDIIFTSKVFDMADLYCEGDLNSLGPFIKAIEENMKHDNSNFSSDYFANARLANLNIKILINSLDEG